MLKVLTGKHMYIVYVGPMGDMVRSYWGDHFISTSVYIECEMFMFLYL